MFDYEEMLEYRNAELIIKNKQLEQEKQLLLDYLKYGCGCEHCKHVEKVIVKEDGTRLCPEDYACYRCETACPCAGCTYMSKWEFDFEEAKNWIPKEEEA